MKLINSYTLFQLTLSSVKSFSVSSQNLLRINQKLLSGRNINVNTKSLSAAASASSNQYDNANTISNQAQIVFNNSLPTRFKLDLPEKEQRDNIIRILHQPVSINDLDSLGLGSQESTNAHLSTQKINSNTDSRRSSSRHIFQSDILIGQESERRENEFYANNIDNIPTADERFLDKSEDQTNLLGNNNNNNNIINKALNLKSYFNEQLSRSGALSLDGWLSSEVPNSSPNSDIKSSNQPSNVNNDHDDDGPQQQLPSNDIKTHDNNNIPQIKINEEIINSNIHEPKKTTKKQLLLLVKGALSHKEERSKLREYYSNINKIRAASIKAAEENESPTQSSNLKLLLDYEIQIKFLVGRAAISETLDSENSLSTDPSVSSIEDQTITHNDDHVRYEGNTFNLPNSQSAQMTYPNNTQISIQSKADSEILLESQKYNDIIIGDFLDNYENLVLKSLLGLEWYTGLDKISRPEYLLMIDDDVDVRVDDLISLIEEKEKEKEKKKMEKSLNQRVVEEGSTISGRPSSDGWSDRIKLGKDNDNDGDGDIDDTDDVTDDDTDDDDDANPLLLCPWKNARRARVSRRGPWAVPVKAYPATHWPSYCGGACYLMNYEAAKKLHNSAKKVVAFDVPIEDAFITGILRERANVELESTRPVCVHNYKRESVTGQFVEQKQGSNKGFQGLIM